MTSFQTEAILKGTYQLDHFQHLDSLPHMMIYAHVKLTIFNL